MNIKIKKFVYCYSKNSRLRTKELGKSVGISQQSASYLINSYKTKKLIKNYHCVIDSAKFGFINIIVYYYLSGYTYKLAQEVFSYLRAKDEIINVLQLSQGNDLSCTFCVPNLSHFNKLNRDFLQSFKGKVFMAEILPVVVKHIYPRNYLVVNKKISEIVISGDRDVIDLNHRDKKVLNFLYKNPDGSIIEMANKLKLNPKTIINVKTKLEKNKILRKYSVIWDYNNLGIEKKQILVSTEGLDISEDKKFLEFCRLHPYIVGLIRLIGPYDFLVEVEGENLSRKSVLKEIRAEFPFKHCKVLIEEDNLKETYVPGNIFE